MILPRVMEWEGENVLGRGHYERSSDRALRGSQRQVLQGRNTREPFASVWLVASGKRAARAERAAADGARWEGRCAQGGGEHVAR